MIDEQLDDSGDTVILIPGHQIEHAQLPKMGLQMTKRALESGFEVKAGYSKFLEPEQRYKGTERKGDLKKEAQTVENHWIDAVNRERKVKFTSVWHDGKFYTGWIGMKLYNSTQLNKIIRGEEV